ncbi:hypothetical protein MMC12_003234 [Toensbergia leucococca]|nr:hypothetical protein [Toensbergia leucococca]
MAQDTTAPNEPSEKMPPQTTKPSRPLLTLYLPIFSLFLFLLLPLTLYLSPLSPPSFLHPQASRQQSCPNTPTLHPTLFRDHFEYQLPDTQSNKAWSDLFTPNGGFLIQPDKEGKNRVYGISMLHQLHCLSMLRTMLVWKMGHGHTGMETRDGEKEKASSLVERHWVHCLDYLRQVTSLSPSFTVIFAPILTCGNKGILCAADSTIESPYVNQHGIDIVNYTTVHQCGDSEALYRMSFESGFVE